MSFQTLARLQLEMELVTLLAPSSVARRLVMEKTARDQPHEDLPDQGIVEDMSTSERDQVAPSHESTHPSSTEDEYRYDHFLVFHNYRLLVLLA